MGYLNNQVVTVDAILTKKGRELLAKGEGNFKITQFALSDDEVDYTMYNPWLNLYKRRDFQEVHDHREHDFACVFIINEGKGFGEFYFKDRNCSLSLKTEQLVNYTDVYVPKLKVGDLIIFPCFMFHGVSPHNSDIIRKTLSFNLDIGEIKG